MKVTVNVDCTPEEARAFMGLPDVRPMQEALMRELEERMRANIQAMSPDSILKGWMPAGMQGVDQVQKMFWGQMQQMMTGGLSGASATLNDKKAG